MIKTLGNNIVNAFTGGNPVKAIYSCGQLVWEKSISNNKIYYTSSDGQIVTPDIGTGEESKGFGANIVSNTYSGCRGVIVFDGPVTKIGYTAFSRCNTLQTIVIPDSVTSIGSYAFSYCTSLTSITIPDSVTSIGQHSFFSCERLTSITIPNGVTSIDIGVFENCRSLTSITIPNSVTSIGQIAFYGCTSLTSITIPNSVKSIDIGVFERCTSLISITIPFSVRNIEYNVFKDCNQLSEVIVNAVTPPELYPEQNTGIYNQFENNAPGRLIKVPSGSVNTYKTASGWSVYANSIISQ